MPMKFMINPNNQGLAMEVDNVDPWEIFGEGTISTEDKLADTDNNFEDDFDDSGSTKRRLQLTHRLQALHEKNFSQ
ncbi:hypothetical protein DITRI_Ditri04bG0102900 [Diplodiscus trichospermus]